MDGPTMYRVVVNDEGQYAIWPAHLPQPAGWHATGVTGAEEECLRHVDEVWTDLRPRSVRSLNRTGAGDG